MATWYDVIFPLAISGSVQSTATDVADTVATVTPGGPGGASRVVTVVLFAGPSPHTTGCTVTVYVVNGVRPEGRGRGEGGEREGGGRGEGGEREGRGRGEGGGREGRGRGEGGEREGRGRGEGEGGRGEGGKGKKGRKWKKHDYFGEGGAIMNVLQTRELWT